MITTPTPKANAMLICDYVITEKDTNKKSLIGIFENIQTSKFPCTHYALCVYVKLTDARGHYRFWLELVDLQKDQSVFRTDIPDEIVIEDPLSTYQLVFNLNGLQFEHAGEYEFRIFANGKIFGQKSFVVREVGE